MKNYLLLFIVFSIILLVLSCGGSDAKAPDYASGGAAKKSLDQQIGTGVGDKKYSQTERVSVEFNTSPNAIINLNYKAKEYIVQKGIINHSIDKYYQKLMGIEAMQTKNFSGVVTDNEASNIDDKMKELSDYFYNLLAQNNIKTVSLLDFIFVKGAKSDKVVGTIGKFFPQEITSNLLSDGSNKFQIIERENIEKVLSEQKYQLSDIIDKTTSVELGKISGVQALLVGSVTKLSKDINIFTKLINVENAKLIGSKSLRIKIDPDIKALLGENVSSSPKNKKLNDNIELLLNTMSYLYEVKIADQYGNPKPIYVHEGKLYTEAVKGENYCVLFSNKSDNDVGVALAIDGVNTIDRKIVKPSVGTKWFVRKKSQIKIEGWFLNENTVEKFIFVSGSKSLAANLGYVSEIGILTAAVYPLKN